MGLNCGPAPSFHFCTCRAALQRQLAYFLGCGYTLAPVGGIFVANGRVWHELAGIDADLDETHLTVGLHARYEEDHVRHAEVQL